MKIISLNEDKTLNILTNMENKLYVMTYKLISPNGSETSPRYFLNVKNDVHNWYEFIQFYIHDINNTVCLIDKDFRLATDKYLQYSIQHVLKLGDSMIKIIVLEFDDLQELINWYKMQPKRI